MEFSLPPAPNWYCSHNLQVSKEGLVAYGSKSGIVILKHFLTEDDNGAENSNWRSKPDWKRPQAYVLTSAFGDKAKVTAVQWSPDSNFLAAASDDGHVKLFKYSDHQLTVTQGHTTHKDVARDQKFKIQGISWTGDSNVVTGDDYGNLVIWDIKPNQTRNMHFGKNTIIVLKSHPFHPDLVAYGVRNGLVFIVNISGNGKIVHKIRAHDEDIHGLDWSPSLTRDVLKDEEDSNDEGSILAVSSRDKSVSIWSLKTASKLAHLRLPMAKTNNNYKSEQSWITLKWFKYNLILVGGASGELCQWNLDKLSKKSPGLVVKSDGQGDEFQILHREHFKNLYSLDSYNNIIFSCGYDRSIVAFNVKANSLAFTLPAFASRIICMASNLVDPSILAIGAGDGVIRIWKTASTKAMFEVAVIYQKPTSRCEITAMAFHPKKENMLAFATEEGRIGIVDALASRPNPMFYDYKYRGSVYNLAWGPPIGDSAAGMNEKDDPNLYSLGDGFVMMHQGRAGNNVGLKSVNIEEVISKTNNWTRKSPSRSNILFQPLKAEFVAIGSDDGSVEIFTIPDLKIVCTLKSFQKLIQSLAWHPFITGGDAITEASKLQHYLAVASNEYDIHVWNLETVLTTPHDNSVLSKPDIVLSGHMLRVISVIWNPNEDGKLLSVSYDGTAEVWDVLEAKGQANFRGHSGRVFCGLWSPADKNIVLTGAEDCMVMGWNVLEQPETVPIKKSNNKKTYNREKKASMALAHNTNSAPADEIQVALELLEAKKAEIVTNNSDEAIHADSRPQKKKLNKRNYFGLAFASEAANRDKAFEDCSILVNNDLSLVQQRPHLAFFGPDILPHLKLEAENVVTSSKGYFYDDDNSVAHLLQWSGNTGEAVEKAIEAERLSDWLVSLAASTSYSLWRSACQTYAKQLAKKDNPVKSASYFLMVSEVAEAIDVLRKANFFQAAISIAKSRLPPDSPIIKDLFRQWAHQASLDGMVELASKCWLASGDLEKAASSLAKRSDGASLRVASSIMAKAGEAEKARVLAFQAMEELKKSNDLDGLQLLAKETTIEEVRDKIESV